MVIEFVGITDDEVLLKNKFYHFMIVTERTFCWSMHARIENVLNFESAEIFWLLMRQIQNNNFEKNVATSIVDELFWFFILLCLRGSRWCLNIFVFFFDAMKQITFCNVQPNFFLFFFLTIKSLAINLRSSIRLIRNVLMKFIAQLIVSWKSLWGKGIVIILTNASFEELFNITLLLRFIVFFYFNCFGFYES